MRKNDIIQSLIDEEVKKSECLIIFDNIESLKTNIPVIESFCKEFNDENTIFQGFFVWDNTLDNNYPEQFIAVDNSMSLLSQLSTLLHEKEHFNLKNSYYGRFKLKLRKGMTEYYVYLNMAKKILHNNFENSIKRQLLKHFIRQINRLCRNNMKGYTKSAIKMTNTRVWKKCLKFNDSLIFAEK